MAISRQQSLPSLQNFTRRLREEQDAAYQQSLRDDQERERQRSAQRTQQEAAERAAAEAAAQARCACISSYCHRLVYLLTIYSSASALSINAREDLPKLTGIREKVNINRTSHMHVMTVSSMCARTGLHRMQRRSALLTGQPCWQPGESAIGLR